MRADYDSWRDELTPDIERGEGYTIGGAGTFRPHRARWRQRASIIDRLRLVLLDMAVLLAAGLAVFLLLLTRTVVFLVVAAAAVAFTGLWFRHQRMDHERRPR